MKQTKKVLAFGTFDIFHPGHDFFLKEAKKLGDCLNVVVARDATVEDVKGVRPLNDEMKRIAVLQSLECVDKVFLGKLGDKYKIIEELKPDIICLGYDQKHFIERLEAELIERGLNVEIVRIEKCFKPELYKSSKLRPV